MKTQTGFRSSTPCMWSSGVWPVTLLFPPRQRKVFHEAILDEILEERVVSSRNRINPRGVERKMSNYKLRPRQRRPTCHLNIVVQLKRTVLTLGRARAVGVGRGRMFADGPVGCSGVGRPAHFASDWAGEPACPTKHQ